MRALFLTAYGDPDVLQMRDAPDPTPGAGEVRVTVHAAGVNFADIQARVRLYPDAPKAPCVLGYEVAGVVESVGVGVDASLVGTRVMAPTRFGGFAELAVAKAADLIPLPASTSFEEGAAIPVVYGTAYGAICKYGNVEEGEVVVIHAAAGGVGTAAIQLAKDRGATIIGTASKAKHERLREMGVEHTIDYRTEDVEARIRAISGGKGVDVILDARAGSGFKESYRLLRAGGRLVIYGANEMVSGEKMNPLRVAKVWFQTPRFDGLDLMQSSRSVIGLNMLKVWDDQGSLASLAKPIAKLLERGVIKPVLGEVFPIEKAADAHRYIQDRKNVGKVVLRVRTS
ncbi:MAG: zinc-binding dehydrogenase [Polyangiaceae bacterium]